MWGLLCDGSPISSSSYPDLYRLCGGRTPDYRGYFLRGLGGNSAGLGVVQGDTVGPHKHLVELWRHDAAGGGIWAYPKYNGCDGTIWTRDNDGTVETRPINKAVNFHIRALT